MHLKKVLSKNNFQLRLRIFSRFGMVFVKQKRDTFQEKRKVHTPSCFQGSSSQNTRTAVFVWKLGAFTTPSYAFQHLFTGCGVRFLPFPFEAIVIFAIFARKKPH
jgi:hypothetical protein